MLERPITIRLSPAIRERLQDEYAEASLGTAIRLALSKHYKGITASPAQSHSVEAKKPEVKAKEVARPDAPVADKPVYKHKIYQIFNPEVITTESLDVVFNAKNANWLWDEIAPMLSAIADKIQEAKTRVLPPLEEDEAPVVLEE